MMEYKKTLPKTQEIKKNLKKYPKTTTKKSTPFNPKNRN